MEMNELRIEEKCGDTWILLPDAISMYDTREIEKAIECRIVEQTKRLVLDFSKTCNLFSSGLGLMIRIRKLVHEKGGRLCLVNVSGRIRGILETLNLDKVFLIYSTDVEYEICQDDIWEERCTDVDPGFLFVAQLEQGMYRLNLSGEMIARNDLRSCDDFRPDSAATTCILDLSALNMIDAHGAAVFRELTRKIYESGARCRVFGANTLIRENLMLLGADSFIAMHDGEESALNV